MIFTGTNKAARDTSCRGLVKATLETAEARLRQAQHTVEAAKEIAALVELGEAGKLSESKHATRWEAARVRLVGSGLSVPPSDHYTWGE